MNSFATYLKRFFDEYLPIQRNLSDKTIKSYKYTFKLFLKFIVNNKNISINEIDFNILNKDIVRNFLSHLEEKGKSINTRNQRLHAIKSFYQFVGIEDPANLINSQQILSIRTKKFTKPLMDYLTIEETKNLIDCVNVSANKGKRNLVLLNLLYDSAARVEEITEVRVMDFDLSNKPTLKIFGKGRKYRTIPIMTKTCDIIKQYIDENNLARTSYLFSNAKNEKLTIRTIEYIVKKYVTLSNCIKNITPHSIRRSRATHMLEAGVNLVYIQHFLGHESIKTTEIYLQVSQEVKRQAIEKAYPKTFDNVKTTSWNNDENLLKELLSL